MAGADAVPALLPDLPRAAQVVEGTNPRSLTLFAGLGLHRGPGGRGYGQFAVHVYALDRGSMAARPDLDGAAHHVIPGRWGGAGHGDPCVGDRKSTRLNSSHLGI